MKQLWDEVRILTGRIRDSTVDFGRDLWSRAVRIWRPGNVVVAVLTAALWGLIVLTLGIVIISLFREWAEDVTPFLEGQSELLRSLVSSGLLACPITLAMSAFKDSFGQLGEFWSSIGISRSRAIEYVNGTVAVDDMRSAFWTSARNLGAGFLVAGMGGAAIAPVEVPQPRVEIGIEADLRTFGTVCVADGLTLVQAKVHSFEKESAGSSHPEHGVVCGYAGRIKEMWDAPRVTAAIHYGFETNTRSARCR